MKIETVPQALAAMRFWRLQERECRSRCGVAGCDICHEFRLMYVERALAVRRDLSGPSVQPSQTPSHDADL